MRYLHDSSIKMLALDFQNTNLYEKKKSSSISRNNLKSFLLYSKIIKRLLKENYQIDRYFSLYRKRKSKKFSFPPTTSKIIENLRENRPEYTHVSSQFRFST